MPWYPWWSGSGAEEALGDARRSLERLAQELAARADDAGRQREAAAMSGAIDRFLEAARVEGLEPEVRRFPEGTKTAQDAARAIGCDVAQIVKSLVFMADDRPVMAFTSGANRVDEAKLASLVGAERSGGRRPRRRGPRPGSRWGARLRSGTPSASRAWSTTTS